MRRVLVAIAVVAILAPAPSAQLSPPDWIDKLEPALQLRVGSLASQSRVIVRASDPAAVGTVVSLIVQLGGVLGRALPIIGAQTAVLPNAALPALASNPLVGHISLDRVAAGA